MGPAGVQEEPRREAACGLFESAEVQHLRVAPRVGLKDAESRTPREMNV